MDEQRRVVPTRRKPLGLPGTGNVQQADSDRVKARCRRRSDDLGRGYRITTEQEVTPTRLQIDRPTHGPLGYLLAPDARPGGRKRSEVHQLDALNRRTQVGLDHLPDGGLPDAARTSYEKQHVRNYRNLLGLLADRHHPRHRLLLAREAVGFTGVRPSGLRPFQAWVRTSSRATVIRRCCCRRR
jgi:hypothetical protein